MRRRRGRNWRSERMKNSAASRKRRSGSRKMLKEKARKETKISEL